MPLLSADLDFEARLRAAMSAPIVYEERKLLAPFPLSGPVDVVVTTAAALDELSVFEISTPGRSLTGLERVAMDRAFWNSVVILDDGIEE